MLTLCAQMASARSGGQGTLELYLLGALDPEEVPDDWELNPAKSKHERVELEQSRTGDWQTRDSLAAIHS